MGAENTKRAAGTFRQSQIVLFGDSLTQKAFEFDNAGWACSLANTYIRRRDVVNRGFSGYTTRTALPLAGPIAGRAVEAGDKVDLVTILLGTNDSVLPFSKQHVPVEETVSNFKEIVSTFREMLPNVRIVAISPPPMSEEMYLDFVRSRGFETPDRNQKFLNVYRHAINDAAGELGLSLVDLWPVIFGGDADADYDKDKARDVLIDGLHFNGKGNQLLFRELMKKIKSEFPELDPENLEYYPPDWKVIGSNDDIIAVINRGN